MASNNEAQKRNLSMTTNAIILIILLILFLLVLGEIIQSDKGKSNFWRKLDAALLFAIFYMFISRLSIVCDTKSVLMYGFPELEIFIFSIIALARVLYVVRFNKNFINY